MSRKSKKKEFDCIEMKSDIQAQMQSEYEKRKVEFNSFADYVNAQCDESAWAKSIVEKIKKSHRSPKKIA
jgi:hypothetical protein